jgi:hypothetical protein
MTTTTGVGASRRRKTQRPKQQRPKQQRPNNKIVESGEDVNKVQYLLIQATMSRARMLWPQDHTSEASRSARQITMRAREEHRRMLGNW